MPARLRHGIFHFKSPSSEKIKTGIIMFNEVITPGFIQTHRSFLSAGDFQVSWDRGIALSGQSDFVESGSTGKACRSRWRVADASIDRDASPIFLFRQLLTTCPQTDHFPWLKSSPQQYSSLVLAGFTDQPISITENGGLSQLVT